ncbi:MAG: ester cyclase [Acidobacteriota bacterium]|nr:ester cyclase [Acidobacteriota bacterium]
MTTNTTIERNKTTVQNLIDAVINTGRADLCDRYLAADRIDDQDYGLPPGAANGHEGFRRVLGPFLEAFPDLHLAIQFMVADDKKLVVLLETTGTHRGAFMGVPATGKRFKVHGVDIFEFNEAGLITHHIGVFNTFGMLCHLGLIPSAEMPAAA